MVRGGSIGIDRYRQGSICVSIHSIIYEAAHMKTNCCFASELQKCTAIGPVRQISYFFNHFQCSIFLNAWFWGLSCNHATEHVTISVFFHIKRMILYCFFGPKTGSTNGPQIKANTSEGALSAFALVGLDFGFKYGPRIGSKARLHHRSNHGAAFRKKHSL